MTSRLPQLDGLRAIAVGLVLLQHATPGLTGDQLSWRAPGSDGVLLFFVLSGFLITGILCRARDEAAAVGETRARVWRAFYARRALRILPVAYAAIALAAALGASRGVPWLAAYIGNFYVARTTGADALSHFWSLAIEEQFYLVWPLVLLAWPRRGQTLLMWGLIAVAGVCRCWYLAHGLSRAAAVLPWTRMDALVAGGLMVDRRPSMVIVASLACAVVACSLPIGAWSAATSEYGRIALCAALVASIASRRPIWIARALSSRPLVYIGTVSYGVYVWHPFVMMPATGLGLRSGRLAMAELVAIGLTVVVAAASWHWLERPFNEMKRFFPYVRPSGSPRPAASDG